MSATGQAHPRNWPEDATGGEARQGISPRTVRGATPEGRRRWGPGGASMRSPPRVPECGMAGMAERQGAAGRRPPAASSRQGGDFRLQISNLDCGFRMCRSSVVSRLSSKHISGRSIVEAPRRPGPPESGTPGVEQSQLEWRTAGRRLPEALTASRWHHWGVAAKLGLSSAPDRLPDFTLAGSMLACEYGLGSEMSVVLGASLSCGDHRASLDIRATVIGILSS